MWPDGPAVYVLALMYYGVCAEWPVCGRLLFGSWATAADAIADRATEAKSTRILISIILRAGQIINHYRENGKKP